jgi:hypothetical protein
LLEQALEGILRLEQTFQAIPDLLQIGLILDQLVFQLVQVIPRLVDFFAVALDPGQSLATTVPIL